MGQTDVRLLSVEWNESIAGGIDKPVVRLFPRYRRVTNNSTSKTELMEAKELLLEQKPLLKAYISAPVKSLLISGEVWLAELWIGDVFMAKAENNAIAYCIPKEGCEVWNDNLVIPKSAPHKYTAEAWLNYSVRAQVSAGVSNTAHYASPVEGAKPFLNKAILKIPAFIHLRPPLNDSNL